MTLEEMKQRKKELGYTYARLSELSGVPLSTVQKIFGGATTAPRYDTMLALESLLVPAPSQTASASVCVVGCVVGSFGISCSGFSART